MPTPLSNVEKYLSVITGRGREIPSELTSRVEYYLNTSFQVFECA